MIKEFAKTLTDPAPQNSNKRDRSSSSQPILLEIFTEQTLEETRQNYGGFLIALAILGIWATSIVYLMACDLSEVSLPMTILACAWQTFLYTGLFITAHDAMHGSILPHHRRLNHGVGAIALMLYGLFSYKQLLKKHWLHHRHPATEIDPDYHDGQHSNFGFWYLHFMQEYWCWVRAFQLVALFYSIHYLLQIPQANLYLFWILPALLSSVQLFYFGTFLPHRQPEGGYKNANCAQSSSFPLLWSFLTCYHFGYHEEHHDYPQIPWWQLPKVRKIAAQNPLND
ncbi:fatty acid desaturase [Desertifilum sp. FACHB-1129]|uniref:beta-carotene ketolase CrtW n=1 Tax=Desertifilum TaxID=1185872 RepID=UPI0009F64A08|nr:MULTISPECIES: fatty acid desaturase [Desertifilum]MBD2310195.1 fatty acid desaturase [Desertifilum sp. FACHB-1129]MBD2322571.1 fatty acid desaturase [Desertifilum sp. FACHB-866]MBD2334624.1 fatty acid desaturase [Desertifilum sp. FACHB-868]MDA0210249.1 fatty acid desaturase [Cyanobacteria bacterium FC1]